jgi:uncharacterized membrane protein
MNQVRLCRIAITIATGATVGWFISVGNVVIPVLAVIIGLALLYLCKSRIQEALEDERTYRISEKASRAALRVFVLVVAFTSIVLVLLGKSNAEVSQAGYILGYSVSALIVLYLVYYGYYSRKYGG